MNKIKENKKPRNFLFPLMPTSVINDFVIFSYKFDRDKQGNNQIKGSSI